MNNRLREIRESKNMSQSDFAKFLGIGQSTLAMMEVGKREILDRHIKTICALCHVSELWLRTGEGEMFVQAKEDIFSRLAAENDLNDFDLMVLKTYVSLKPDQRQALVSFFNAMSAVKTDQQLAAEVDAEMAAELAAEREERIVERGTPMSDPSTASNAG